MSEDSAVEMFGSNQLVRIETIRRLAADPLRKARFRFRGTNQDMPVISVKINLPVYRIGNRRTKTLQEEYVIKHPELPNNFFEVDCDSVKVQKAQDEILQELIAEKDLYEVFTNPSVQQDEPIICTRTGEVVNGNRRLCAWRKLYMSDAVKYQHFSAVEIMLLPEDTDEKDVNNIERDLQIKRAIKSEYSWHAKANMIQMDFDTVRSYDELSKMYDMSKAELVSAMECYAYAKKYLASIGKLGQWSEVDKNDYAFKKIIREKKKIRSVPEQKIFEACSSALLQVSGSEVGDRRYDVIPEIAKNLRPIIDVLKKDMLPTKGYRSVAVDPLGIVQGNDDDSDLYVIETLCRKPENVSKTVSLVTGVIDNLHQRQRDELSSQLLLKDLTEISTDLISVKNKDLDDRQEGFDAIKNQLKSIFDTCKYIQDWVTAHENQS